MDWPESTDPKITVFPRGSVRYGRRVGPVVDVEGYPSKWTSKYGSMITTAFGIGTVDGFNERGLGAHLPYLKATDFGPRDTNKLGSPTSDPLFAFATLHPWFESLHSPRRTAA